MNKKEIFENYIKNLYGVYTEKNFDEFINSALNYNIRIGNYRSDISLISKNLFNKILSRLPESKAKFSYKEFKHSFKINLLYTLENDPTPQIIIDVPVFVENLEKITLNILEFIIENKINCNIKFLKVVKNSLLEIRVESIESAKKIARHFKIDSMLIDEVKSRVLPILPQENLLGFSMEYKPFSFKNFYFICLYSFFSKVDNIEDINIDNFQTYIENRYKNERRLNKRRMLIAIYKSIYILNNDEDVYSLYAYDSVLDIGSIDPVYFEIKKDKDGMIYFENKEDKRILSFGSEDFLNIVYSKFYENVIKNKESIMFYSYFYNIFNKILSTNYKDVDKLLDFSQVNNDKIYQLMMTISCCFFAYKKMGFSLDEINTLLSQVLSKQLNTKILIKKSEEYEKKDNRFLFPLNDEYGNKVVDLKNGNKITIKEYFRLNNVLNVIPLESLVYLKNGTTIVGRDFLNNIYKYIDKYDNFIDLRNDLINFVEFY